MKNARVINILSALFNAAILGGVIYATVTFLLKDFVGNLVFFTVLSNLLVGLAALICLPFNLVGIAKKKLLPKGVYIFKLIATACVAVTFVVATALLPILSGSTIPAQYGDFSFQKVEFFMHLIIPAVSMLGFIFFDHTEKAKFPVTLLAIIPVALYSGFYTLNYFLHLKSVVVDSVETYDWYGFVKDPSQLGLAIGLLAGVIVGAFVLAAILFLLNRLLTKGLFKEAPVAEPALAKEEAAPVEEEKPAPAPVEEPEEEPEPEAEEQAEEEPEPEPVKEEPAKKPAPAKKAAPAKAEPAKKEEKTAPAKKVAPAKKAEEKPAPAKAEPAKKEEKPAPAKKAEAKPVPAKKQEAKPAPAKAQPAKEETQTKVYHLTKRKEDGMWAITFVGGQKAVKLFKTKKEAEAALKVLTENQGATALIRNSKGAKAGKFASSIKASEDEKK